MIATDGTARCTNSILKQNIEIRHWPESQKALDRLPRERCARPLLPIYNDAMETLGWFCYHCDGPLHTHTRGPDVTKAYNERRQAT